MLKMPELWDAYQGKVYNQPKREECVAVNKTGKSKRSDEPSKPFDTGHRATGFDVV